MQMPEQLRNIIFLVVVIWLMVMVEERYRPHIWPQAGVGRQSTTYIRVLEAVHLLAKAEAPLLQAIINGIGAMLDGTTLGIQDRLFMCRRHLVDANNNTIFERLQT
jgi:hypothetical protein